MQERVEVLKADAAYSDVPSGETLALNVKATKLKGDLAATLERLAARVRER